MTRIELESIVCQSCGAAQSPGRFRMACPDCGFGRFRVRVARRSRGFDPSAMEIRLEWLLWFGALAPLIQAAVDGPETMVPFHSWTSKDDLEHVAGEEVERFLALPEAGRRNLFRRWMRAPVEAGLMENQKICNRCDLIFVAHANAWHREAYCSKKCFDVDTRTQRSGR